MIEKSIISAVAIFMLILTIKKGNKKEVLLTSGLTLGILLTWIEIHTIITIGMVVYMLFAFAISVNSIKSSELQFFKRTSITITGIWAFIVNLFSILHLPFYGEIRLSLIIPIVLYIILLIQGLTRKKEFGYLTIMNCEFLIRLI